MVYQYQPDTRHDEPVTNALSEAAERYPRYGFKKFFQVFRRWGKVWNHKRVHRLHCLIKLIFRLKGKQHLTGRISTPQATPVRLNQNWSVHFMHDALVSGRRFLTFNVVHDFNHEAIAVEIDLNISANGECAC